MFNHKSFSRSRCLHTYICLYLIEMSPFSCIWRPIVQCWLSLGRHCSECGWPHTHREGGVPFRGNAWRRLAEAVYGRRRWLCLNRFMPNVWVYVCLCLCVCICICVRAGARWWWYVWVDTWPSMVYYDAMIGYGMSSRTVIRDVRVTLITLWRNSLDIRPSSPY